MQSQRDELASQMLIKHYIMLSLNMSVTSSACLFDLFAVGRFILKLLTRRCTMLCVTSMSQWFLSYMVFIVAIPFLGIPFTII